jgi:Tfp pilus assembly major pilin PilA
MFSTEKRGFKAQVVKQFIGVMVVIIIGVAVVLPVIQNVTASAGLTGITATIVGYLSTFVAIALLLVVTGLF